jgi:hypothetical protein
MYPFGLLEKFKRVWSGDARNKEKSTISGVIGGFLKTFEEEKGPQITYPKNFIYLNFYLLINLNKFVLWDFFHFAPFGR